MSNRHFRRASLLSILSISWMCAITHAQGPLNWGRYCSNGRCSMCNRIEATNRTRSYLRQQKAQQEAAARQRAEQHRKDVAMQMRQAEAEAQRARAVQAQQVLDLFDPTPTAAVQAIVELLDLSHLDVLYDPGCGDGRFLIAAAQRYGCRCVGLEIQPEVAELARKRVAEAGLGHLITIYQVDARLVQFAEATVVYMYLFPDLMDQLPLDDVPLVVSYLHEYPGAVRRQIAANGDTQPVYIREGRAEFSFSLGESFGGAR